MITMHDPTTSNQRAWFAELIEWERDLTAKAAAKTPPDLILISNKSFMDFHIWARMNASMDEMLRGYKEIGKKDNLSFLIRRTPEEMAKVPTRSELID
jgi:hypothetical protein